MSRQFETRFCAYCHQPFLFDIARAKHRIGKFCSRECSFEHKRASIPDRFKKYVGEATASGCIPWIGNTNESGYGMIYWKQRPHLAHRVAWELANGPIPDGLCVLHSCDNPPCVNPNHLFLGTRTDNKKDCVAKGRQAKGTDFPQAKLNESIVRQIRSMKSSGNSRIIIAETLGVSVDCVKDIVSGRRWNHVT